MTGPTLAVHQATGLETLVPAPADSPAHAAVSLDELARRSNVRQLALAVPERDLPLNVVGLPRADDALRAANRRHGDGRGCHLCDNINYSTKVAYLKPKIDKASEMTTPYSYKEAFEASVKMSWQVEDLMAEENRLDFNRPFLPECLARVESLAFLSPRERMVVNQIRGYGYLYLFGAVEKVVLPFVLNQAQDGRGPDHYRTQALLQFAGQEAKHIHLFERCRQEFEKEFGTRCAVTGPIDSIARSVLRHDPLAVALAVLHIEWMAQCHFVEAARENDRLDPLFKNLLRYHWAEEAQHAKLDTLMVLAMARDYTPQERVDAAAGYIEIVEKLDEALKTQAALDLETFERHEGRMLSPQERETAVAVQHQAMRWTFIGSGMTHPKFVQTLSAISLQAAEDVSRVAPAFC